jgi:uncharacterized protein (TIGR00725 family)
MSPSELTDQQIAQRLRLVAAVITPAQGVRNEIVEVAADSVTVESERTGTRRRIPFRDLRHADQITTNGVIVRVLAQVLGLGVSDEPREARPAAPTTSAPPAEKELLQFYLRAKDWVEKESPWSIDEVGRYDPSRLADHEFLGEYAWALYVSGFKASTVAAKWSALERAWQAFNPAAINKSARDAAFAVIAHPKKANAILEVATRIREAKGGWPSFKEAHCRSADALGALPWMGPANRRFLARNLGIGDFGKPDRWIERLAAAFRFDTTDHMLEVIRGQTDDSPSRSDFYLWAYLSDNPDALPPSAGFYAVPDDPARQGLAIVSRPTEQSTLGQFSHPKPLIAVVGAKSFKKFDIEKLAFDIGAEIARQGCWLLCGGTTGVMEAAPRGAKAHGGFTVGIVPLAIADITNENQAEEWPGASVDLAIFTGLGGGIRGRNRVLISACDAVIGLPGGGNAEKGTRSEVNLAVARGVPLVLHPHWRQVKDPVAEAPPLMQYFTDAADAVARAVTALAAKPHKWPHLTTVRRPAPPAGS